MKDKKFTLGALLLFFIGLAGIHAQEVILATGGEASGSEGSASYSVGQVVYTTNTGPNGSLAQGVQQPYEISIISEFDDFKDVDLWVSAYPNPTMDYLLLQTEGYDHGNLSYKLYDINGQLLENKRIITYETIISVKNLGPSAYILKVINGDVDLMTFKIIKNK